MFSVKPGVTRVIASVSVKSFVFGSQISCFTKVSDSDCSVVAVAVWVDVAVVDF